MKSLPLVFVSQLTLVSSVPFKKYSICMEEKPPFFSQPSLSVLHKWLYGTNSLYIEIKIKGSFHNTNSFFYKEIFFKKNFFSIPYHSKSRNSCLSKRNRRSRELNNIQLHSKSTHLTSGPGFWPLKKNIQVFKVPTRGSASTPRRAVPRSRGSFS